MQAKIFSVADTFDAMTIDRPYQKGMLLPDALNKIKEFVGTRYDGAVVSALIRGCDAGEIGQGVVRFLINAKNAELESQLEAEIDAETKAKIEAEIEAEIDKITTTEQEEPLKVA